MRVGDEMQESKIVQIEGPFITLGQLLKEESIIASGGAAKWFLRENEVLVNDEIDQRRGRKLIPMTMWRSPRPVALSFKVSR